MDKPVNPLSQSDLEMLRDWDKQINIAQQHLNLAKKAGIDMPDLQKVIDDTRDRRTKLLLVYGNPDNFK